MPINLRVETLIQPSRCQLTAPVKTGVQNMYMKCTCTSPRISVIGCLIFLFAVVFRWSSYLATTVRSAPVVSLHNGFREHSLEDEVDH